MIWSGAWPTSYFDRWWQGGDLCSAISLAGGKSAALSAASDAGDFCTVNDSKLGKRTCMPFIFLKWKDPKSANFPFGRLSSTKTFRTKCVNRFHDIYTPKVRKLLSRHRWQSANIDWIGRKLSRLFENFPDCPETFQYVWKLFRLSRNFPVTLETFRTFWKISRQFG